jgi:hypothetical protein
VILEQFAIQEWSARFQGTVERIDFMYTPGWLLDEILSLEFIEFVNIPFYRWSERWYNFTLDATIKEYDRVEWSL